MRPHLGCAAAEMAHWRAGIARDHAKCAAPLQHGHIVTTTSAKPWHSLLASRPALKKAGHRPCGPRPSPRRFANTLIGKALSRFSHGRLLLGLGLADGCLATNRN